MVVQVQVFEPEFERDVGLSITRHDDALFF